MVERLICARRRTRAVRSHSRPAPGGRDAGDDRPRAGRRPVARRVSRRATVGPARATSRGPRTTPAAGRHSRGPHAPSIAHATPFARGTHRRSRRRRGRPWHPGRGTVRRTAVSIVRRHDRAGLGRSRWRHGRVTWWDRRSSWSCSSCSSPRSSPPPSQAELGPSRDRGPAATRPGARAREAPWPASRPGGRAAEAGQS
jgi:hypothetical protein